MVAQRITPLPQQRPERLQRGRTPYPRHQETTVKGGDYLPVAARIQWMRGDYPCSRIETDMISISATGAVMRCTVTLVSDDGAIEGSGTGTGSCKAADFGNFIEKAETKAVGRALGLCGYGTQDLVDDDELTSLPDTPLKRVLR